MSEQSKLHATEFCKAYKTIKSLEDALFDAVPKDRSRITWSDVAELKHLNAILSDALAFISKTAR